MKQSDEVYKRLNECLETLFEILHEPATMSSSMLLLRDLKNKWQVHLTLTKDEFDFCSEGFGEVVVPPPKRKIKTRTGPSRDREG